MKLYLRQLLKKWMLIQIEHTTRCDYADKRQGGIERKLHCILPVI